MPSRLPLPSPVLAPLVAIGVGFALAAPAEAQAVTAAELQGLRDAPCPAPYKVMAEEEAHSAATIAAARSGRFEVGGADLLLEVPVDWKQDPVGAKKFRGELHELSWLDVLFYDYRQNDDVGALAQARDLVLDWIQASPLKDPISDKAWVNKIAAYRSLVIAYTARAAACEGILNEDSAAELLASVEEHGDYVAGPAYKPTNKGPSMDIALAMLAMQVPFMASASEWDETARSRYRETVMGRVIESEGFWLEHSTNYHMVVRAQVRKLIDFFGDPDGALGALHDRMTEVAGWLVMPDDHLVQLGDSHRKPAPGQVLEAAADDHGLAWLEETGLAIVKEAGSFLSFASTFHNGTHKQSDDLSFDLFESGHQIVSDTGVYDKDPGPWFTFTKSAPAHSVLTVDGAPLPRGAGRAYGSGLRARGQGDGWYALLAENPLLGRQGVGHRRLLLYRPDEALVVVDLVRSKKRHTYRRYFQIGPELDASGSRSGLKLEAPGFDGHLELRDGGRGRTDRVKGERKPLLGFTSPEYRQALERWTVIRKTDARDADMLAGFRLDGRKPLEAALTTASGDRWVVRLGDGRLAAALEVERNANRLVVEEK